MGLRQRVMPLLELMAQGRVNMEIRDGTIALGVLRGLVSEWESESVRTAIYTRCKTQRDKPLRLPY